MHVQVYPVVQDDVQQLAQAVGGNGLLRNNHQTTQNIPGHVLQFRPLF